MANPFEAETGNYLVLVNEEGQYGLWPAFHTLPAGWYCAAIAAASQNCLTWTEANWAEIRPKALAAADSRSGR